MLSIIIPVYNGEVYLEETIKSILSSDLKDFEIVAVDDGSTDSSKRILDTLAQTDIRVKVFSKENSGIAATRNYGIDKAKGEYISFVDQDDKIIGDVYMKLVEEIQQKNADISICSSSRLLNEEIIPLEKQEDCIYEKEEILDSLILPIFLRGYNNPYTKLSNRFYHVWNCVFRRGFLKDNNIRFRAYVNFEDDLLMKVEALCKAYRVATIKEIGYLWRINTISESFAHHFVVDIGEKQNDCYLDIEKSLLYSGIDEERLRWVRASIFSNQFLDALYNLSSKEYKKNIKKIREYCENNIYNRNIDEVAWINHNVKNGWVKLKVILPFLIRKRSIIAFDLEIIIEMLLYIQVKYKKLLLLEKKIKRH